MICSFFADICARMSALCWKKRFKFKQAETEGTLFCSNRIKLARVELKCALQEQGFEYGSVVLSLPFQKALSHVFLLEGAFLFFLLFPKPHARRRWCDSFRRLIICQNIYFSHFWIFISKPPGIFFYIMCEAIVLCDIFGA